MHFRERSLRLGLLPLAAALMGLLACGGANKSTPQQSTTTLTLGVGSSQWLAIQDGDGPWTSATPRDGYQTFTIHDAAGRYGVAYGWTDWNGYKQIRIFQATLKERSNLVDPGSSGPITLTGNVTGLASTEIPTGYFRDGSSYGNPMFLQATPGTGDLVVIGTDTSTGAGLRALISRGQTYTSSGSIPDVNLSSATTLVSYPYTIRGAGSASHVPITSGWYTAGGTFAVVSASDGATGNMAYAPPSLMVPGEVQGLNAYVGGRSVSVYFATSGDKTLDLPPVLNGTISGSGATIQAHWDEISGAKYYVGFAQQTGTKMYLRINLTAGWLGSGSTHAYSTPDLQAVSGPGWTLASGQSVTWGLSAWGMTYWYQSDGSWATPRDGDSDWTTKAGGSFLPASTGPSTPLQGSETPLEDLRPFRRPEL